MAQKKIIQSEEPLLRQRSEEIVESEIGSEWIKNLMGDMEETLDAQPVGVGISAVQIGVPKRIFLVNIKPGKNRPDRGGMGARFFINPIIKAQSEETIKYYEACLSIKEADLYGEVERPESMVLEYTDELGKRVEKEYSGFMARVILHEMGHLEGKLFTDIVDEKTLMTAEEYREFTKKRNKTNFEEIIKEHLEERKQGKGLKIMPGESAVEKILNHPN
jgi:peptide deformylase